MYRIIATQQYTNRRKVIRSGLSKNKAYSFCRRNAWTYTDGNNINYWLCCELDIVRTFGAYAVTALLTGFWFYLLLFA